MWLSSGARCRLTFLVPAHPVVPNKGPLNVCVCVCQLCSDSVDLNSDTITVDSVSLSSLPVSSLTRDSASFIAQMKPDVSAPSVISAEPQRGLSHSSDLLLVSSHAYKQDSLTNSVTTGTVPSIVIPSASAVDNSANRSSSQQRPKSLDQEFTLLNLDIPNVTIRGVSCFYVYAVVLLPSVL